MTTNQPISCLAGIRYGDALFDLALDSDTLDSVRADLASLTDALSSDSELSRLAGGPLMDRARGRALIAAIVPALNPTDLTHRFLNLLAENRRLALIESAAARFARRCEAHHGIRRVTVESARPLTKAQRERLDDALTDALDTRCLILEEQTIPDLIGGLRLRIDSLIFDASVSGQLTRLARRLTTNG
ncbi:MAG: ATP synthase F1 subunit delta [Pseudomonadota bacterium]|nr:ATP synthase F1 subunit delta [Pseudomonadota bacterium]